MKIKVAVIFGGKSTEHEISIISAVQAMNNMDTEKYDIIPVYITRDNKYYCGEKIEDIENYSNISELLKASQQVILVKGNQRIELYKFPFGMFSNKPYDYIDIAFPIVHGTNVEDGALQGFLQYFGVPVVGSDVLASAVGMDKYVMKVLLKEEGIPVLEGWRKRGDRNRGAVPVCDEAYGDFRRDGFPHRGGGGGISFDFLSESCGSHRYAGDERRYVHERCDAVPAGSYRSGHCDADGGHPVQRDGELVCGKAAGKR